MDTKSKKYSRSRAVKAIMLIIYIICFGAMGIITSYLPVNGYFNNSIGAILCNEFEDTYIYRNALYMKQMEVFDTRFTKESVAQLAANADYYVCIEASDGTLYSSEVAPYSEKSVVTSDIDNGRVISVFNGVYILKGTSGLFESVSIGLPETEYIQLYILWQRMVHNMWVVIITDLVLLAVGITLICLLCRVSGESSDGTVSLRPFFKTFYEVTIIIIIAAISLFIVCLDEYWDAWGCEGFAFMDKLFMVLAGAVTAVSALMLLYLFVSMSVRAKNKRFAEGSIIFCLCRLVWRLLCSCSKGFAKLLRRLKELFTGELYKGTAARRLLWIDSAFISVSAIILILFAVGFGTRGLMALWIVLELVFLGLFLHGRYLIIRDGAVLERQIKELYNGNYGYSEPMHKNSPYGESSELLYKLAAQYRKGIEESVKAERMRVDLVTNVSHDLKTPLTSIISYVELLSKEELSPTARDYVTILRKKSERLKNIVSDVFELAKTTSGEISVSHERLDLNKLSYQTLAEMEDKIARSGFAVKAQICEPPVTVVSDGKRIYRIIQNLLDNALKYSLAGTRIYYTLEKRGGRAVITIKNIAAYEMNFTTEEILERFSRGDKSRTTEGSGLGLSIAQGFTLACGGDFNIDIDGDMFKAIVSFPLLAENAAAAQSQDPAKPEVPREALVPAEQMPLKMPEAIFPAEYGDTEEERRTEEAVTENE